MKRTELLGMKVSVIGAERSGAAVATLLHSQHASVFVSDHGNSEQTKKHIDDLRARNIDCEFGGHTARAYDCALMVISPGVPTNAPVILEARKRGIHVVAEIEVASWFCVGSIIAITGSNGKTTTTTLLGRIFSDAKKKHVVAGNIGTAFSSVVLDVDEETLVVLEVSSFQLDFIDTFRPNIGVIVNITQNHLDRYNNSMEQYASSKARIVMNQTKDDIVIYNADDEWTKKSVRVHRSTLYQFSSTHHVTAGAYVDGGYLKTSIANIEYPIIAVDEISIKGEHNLQNAMAAALTAQLAGVKPASIKSTLRNFKGVEHRQEFVRDVNGITYINNSKATTVEAVGMSIKSYDKPIILIMGGKDKGNDYSALYGLVKKKVKAIVATGYSSETIVKNFSELVHVEQVETVGTEFPNVLSMEKAIAAATSLAKHGDIVLLSPACTSFDWFNDFEERGKIFKQLVNAL